ncbi:hypothetical protein DV736_g4179, partial [Chaetothyriales sp. CBS 134916]
MSIFPYAYQMVESFELTDSENQTSMYAGMLITAFAFAEFSTGMLWGRVSDALGRKPVLIMGLIGTTISMVSFGFSTSLQAAILSRALGGLLNGNVGVLQTTVAELVTKKEHQPRAYSIMPFVWCLGSIIGPAMGGALAMPCESYPWLFPKGTLFDEYPFLLPNLVCVVILAFGICTGLLFLEETHPQKKHRRDIGLETSKFILSKITGKAASPTNTDKAPRYGFGEFDPLTVDPPPGYQSAENSPRLSSTTAASIAIDIECLDSAPNRGLSACFNRQVILVIVGYAILAYHSVSFDTLMPVFLSEERSEAKPSLPFKFSGGFGLSTKAIGLMMAVQGIYSMIAQLWLFPIIVRRIGTLTAFRSVMIVWPFLYLVVPYLVLLPDRFQHTGIYMALLVKITFHVIAFPSNAILLANAAPSKSVLGTINGVAASAACLARAFGPTVTGSIHSAGLKFGCNGLAWWAGGIICSIGALESYWMEECEMRMDSETLEEEQPVCEPLLHATPVEASDDAGPQRRESLASIQELDPSLLKESKPLAEVIKIEHPTRGDDTRAWGPPFAQRTQGFAEVNGAKGPGESAYFASVNRNKKSIGLSFQKPEGVNILHELAKSCDVLVENYVPGSLKKYQLDYETMHRLNPSLIYASITGYGQYGPYSRRAGYDVMVEAEFGLMHITGERGGPPVKVGVAVTDLTTGLYTCNAILASLLHRSKSGSGQHLDVALSDVQTATLANIASSVLISGERDGGRWGTAHPSIVPYKGFKTADGDIMLGGGNDRLFGIICDKVNKPEWKTDERFVTNNVRVNNRVLLETMIEDETKKRTTQQWLDILQDSGLPYAAINDVKSTLELEHSQARGMVTEVEHETCDTMKLVSPPVKYSEPGMVEIRTAPPTLGQHTDEVLRSILSKSDEEICVLRNDGVVS